MTKNLPDRSSRAADDGTLTHHILEQALFTGIVPVSGMKYIHASLGGFTCDTDRAERVTFCLDYIYARMEELKPCDLHPEENMDSSLTFGRDDLGGTTDVRLISESVLEVIDLKDGTSPVAAEENDQLVIYGILSLAEAIRQGRKIETVRLTILQPKMRWAGGSGIDYWETTPAWLLAQIPIILQEAKATEDPSAPLVPGEVQCKYCRAKGTCSALNNHIMVVSGISFENLTLSHSVANTDIGAMENERIKDIILAAPLIRSMLESVEEEAMERFRRGNPVQGLKVIAGRGTRSWSNPEVMEKKLMGMGIPKAALYKQSLISVAQLEKLTWEKKGEIKKLTDRQKAVLDKEYISKGSGSPKVVSEESSGTPIELCPARLFSAVPDQDIPDWLN
jgi:hypothetical protein